MLLEIYKFENKNFFMFKFARHWIENEAIRILLKFYKNALNGYSYLRIYKSNSFPFWNWLLMLGLWFGMVLSCFRLLSISTDVIAKTQYLKKNVGFHSDIQITLSPFCRSFIHNVRIHHTQSLRLSVWLFISRSSSLVQRARVSYISYSIVLRKKRIHYCKITGDSATE